MLTKAVNRSTKTIAITRKINANKSKIFLSALTKWTGGICV